MGAWPGGQLETIEGGRHEVLMEDAITRGQIVTRMADLFSTSLKHGSSASRSA